MNMYILLFDMSTMTDDDAIKIWSWYNKKAYQPYFTTIENIRYQILLATRVAGSTKYGHLKIENSDISSFPSIFNTKYDIHIWGPHLWSKIEPLYV